MSSYEHVCAACGATTRERMADAPRVWRAGDPEPGEEVRAVLDQYSRVWLQSADGEWRAANGGYCEDAAAVLHWYGPLVEVIQPQPVTA